MTEGADIFSEAQMGEYNFPESVNIEKSSAIALTERKKENC